MRSDAAAPGASGPFVSVSDTRAGRARNGVRSGFAGEGAEERCRGRVVLAHRRQAEDQLDRPEHGRRGVEGGVERSALRPRARHQQHGAMRVDMVRAVLGVVLDDQDR